MKIMKKFEFPRKCKLCEENYDGSYDRFGGYCSKLCRLLDMQEMITNE